jgi:hypothetical protein
MDCGGYFIKFYIEIGKKYWKSRILAGGIWELVD